MKTRTRFFIFLFSPLVAMFLLLVVFWWSGVAVLPTEDRSFVGNARMIKPWIVFDKSVDAILTTNSRGVYGYNPEKLNNINMYNFSLTGVGPYEMGRMVEHAFYSGHQEAHYFIGIDTICGEQQSQLNGSFFNDDYLQQPPNILFNRKRIKSLISSPADLLRRKVLNKPGFNDAGYQLYFPDDAYVKRGVFRSLQVRELMDYRQFEFSKGCDTSAYEHMLNFLYKHNMSFVLFANPKHVRTFIAYDLKDELQNYYAMLKQYVSISESIAQLYSQIPATVYFNQVINDKTTERFPQNDSVHDPMFGWYENSHFKQEIGNAVLASMVKQDTKNRIDKNNIEQFIQQLNADLQSYMLSNPIVVEEVDEVIRKIESEK